MEEVKRSETAAARAMSAGSQREEDAHEEVRGEVEEGTVRGGGGGGGEAARAAPHFQVIARKRKMRSRPPTGATSPV